MMSLAPGSRVFLLYDVPPPELYHERYVMASCMCGRGWHVIWTPDHDLYAEQISLENSHIPMFRIADQLPVVLTAQNTYRIRKLLADDMMAQLRRDEMLPMPQQL